MKYQGTVKWFSNKKGFGFIAPTSENAPTKDEIFVHQTAIVTDGAYRTLQEEATVQFEIETEAETGKLKAIQVTNPDGTPIVPPPRERRRRPAKGKAAVGEGSGGEGAGAAASGEDEASPADPQEDGKKKKSRPPRKSRKGKNGKAAGEGSGAPVGAPTPKEAPFHAALNADVQKKMTDKGLELGKRTTVDVSVGDARIKLGQGGYAGCATAKSIVGEGTYTAAPDGTVTFSWERCLVYQNGAWAKSDTKVLLATLSLADDAVGPVKPDETPETLWGKEVPEPMEAFEANGFLMRRVRLTRPPRRGAPPAESK